MNVPTSKHSDSYSICQFDLNNTELSKGSIIDCDSKHIKTGSKMSLGYAMVLCDNNDDNFNNNAYRSGQHCFRLYYKNPYGSLTLLFGIYQSGVKPKNLETAQHETSWGVGIGGCPWIFCNGKQKSDPTMEYLYIIWLIEPFSL